MDRLLQLGAGGLPGMGQVRRLYSFKSFHSRLQGLSYIDHTLSVGPQQPLPKPPGHLSEKLHYVVLQNGPLPFQQKVTRPNIWIGLWATLTVCVQTVKKAKIFLTSLPSPPSHPLV